MTGIVLVLALAIITEALVEYAKTIGKAIVQKDWKTASTQGVAIAVSIILCFATGADIFGAIGINFSLSWLGYVLTGIFASRGANYAADIIKRIQNVGADNSLDKYEEEDF